MCSFSFNVRHIRGTLTKYLYYPPGPNSLRIGNPIIYQERFTLSRYSREEPDRSVGKEPRRRTVSLSAIRECLSLQRPILPHRRKSGNGQLRWWHFLSSSEERGLRVTRN